ncbi:hypothetical protein L3Q82_021204 [Scortum barcoo]|uniref:Uncharacterized protein n=1 Tax=Scortum barcoo TaxID=214431 RepID=A0ACB8X3L4_9TELE|nr:hypothetical protein L3Q82_021204 [Scortum barcoo]
MGWNPPGDPPLPGAGVGKPEPVREVERVLPAFLESLGGFEAVDTRSLVHVVAAIPKPSGGGHTEVRDAVNLKKEWTMLACWTPRTQLTGTGRPKQASHGSPGSPGGQKLGSGRSSDLLNPTDTPSTEEVRRLGTLRWTRPSPPKPEVTEVVLHASSSVARRWGCMRSTWSTSSLCMLWALSWLTHLCSCSIAWRLGTVPLEWQTRVVVFKKGDRENVSSSTSSTHRVLERFMGVFPTGPHVLCGSGEGIRPCPSWYSVGSAPRVWGPGAFAKGCSVSVRSEQELGSHCLVVSQTCSQCMLDSGQGCPLSPVLFIIFMDRIL